MRSKGVTTERTADHLKSCELSRKLKEQGVVVRTNFQCFGWVAVDENTYDGIGSHLGRGKTEYGAIEDLMEQIRDRNT